MARSACVFLVAVSVGYGQTQVDLNRQVRNALPYGSGGTGAVTQINARKNVGTPHLVATDFSGADIGAQINNAFASFGAGRCGTVAVPAGAYTFATQIQIPHGCALVGAGRGFEPQSGVNYNTVLIYNGPPATSAIVAGTPTAGTSFVRIEGLTIQSQANVCPSNGWLQWNPDAAGVNKWQCAAYQAGKTISGATNAAPISISAVGHGYSTNDRVLISGVGGNNGANGEWKITVTDADHFTLNGSTGNAAYTSGGKAERIAYSAAVPHLAAIQHGNTDPTQLTDGTHVTIRDIYVSAQSPNGGHTGNFGQGAFHFGLYLNGCEECQIETMYVLGATDGFLVGQQANAVVFNMITARLNRRAGFHYRGQNNFVVYGGTFESNEWFFNRGTDVDKYGHGILGQEEPNTSFLAYGGEFNGTYFENNDCDLCSPLHEPWSLNVRNSTRGFGGGLFTPRAQWNNAILENCDPSVTVDSTLSYVNGSLTLDCPFSGPFQKAPGAATYKVVKLDRTKWIERIYTPGADGTIYATYEAPVTQDMTFTFRRRAGDGGAGVVLDAYKNANAADSVDSAMLRFRESVWTGTAAPKDFTIYSTSHMTAGAPDTSAKLAIDGPGSEQNFEFREHSVFRVSDNLVGDTPTIELGGSSSQTGFPNNNSTPTLSFLYRSDADASGAHIGVSRGGGAPNDGKLFFDGRLFQFGAGSSVTVAIKPNGIQTANQQEWYDTTGALTSYVSSPGGIAVKPTGTQPACSATTRFLIWTVPGGTGVKDAVQVCAKDAADAYGWRTIF